MVNTTSAPSPAPSPLASVPGLASSRRDWAIAGAALAIGLLSFAIIFYPEIAAAIVVWMNSDAYSHCFLVLPVAIYLAWDRRDIAKVTPLRPSLGIALLAVPAAAIWFAADRLGIMEARQLMAMTLLQIMIASVLGPSMSRALAAPLLYLFFLVPFGEFLIPPLQSLAVRFTTVGLNILGIPNFADGIVIEIPEGTFLVHQACSGLRFLIASAAFSVFFACLIYTSPLRRALFIAAAFAVAVIANDFRVLGIILIAHFIGNAQAIETGHVLWGWLFYVIVGSVLVLMGLAFRQERRSPVRATLPVAGRFPGAAVAALVFVVLLATMPRVAANYLDKFGLDAAVAATIPPPALAGCTIVPLSAANPASTVEEHGRPAIAYRCDDRVFIVTFHRFPPRIGVRPLFASLRDAESGGGADIVRQAQGVRGGVGPEAPVWSVTENQQGRRYVTVATTLWVDGRPAGTGIWARLDQALNTLRLSAVSPVAVVVTHSEAEDPNSTWRAIDRFLAKTEPFSRTVNKLLSTP
jgi:exosortase A